MRVLENGYIISPLELSKRLVSDKM